MPSRGKAGEQAARIAALVNTIREAEQQLQELTGGQLDAIVSDSGQAYLLREAQDRLVQSREVERSVAATQRAILDALPAHVALVDADGTVRQVNAAWMAFGAANDSKDPRNGVGSNYVEVARRAGEAGDTAAAKVAEALAAVLAGEREFASVEYPCHSPTKNRWFRAIVSPVRDEEIRGAVVMHLDITEKRESEAALQRSERALRESRALQLLAERLGRIGGWTLDASSQQFVWADEVCAIHGVSRGNKPTLEEALAHYAPEDQPAMRRVFADCIEKGRAFDIEAKLVVGTDRKWVRVLGEPRREPAGEITGVEGALQDITERKLLEQQFLRAQRMESVGTLAGGIAHDLNNVLTPILMSVELLRLDDGSGERHELLAGIELAARRGADMVRQVLAFARGADGRRAEVDVRQLVADLAKICRETFPKQIEVRTEVAPDLLPVLGDPTQLHQVLLNLCVNARDAMPRGGTLTVRVRDMELDEQYVGMTTDAVTGPYVVIEVEDTGTGMSAEVLERIFEPFFTTKEPGKGTGLGLSTSIAIVRSHGGFVRAYSEPGRGSRFRLYLPSVTEASSAGSAPLAPALPRGRGELILVVDDEAPVRGITQQTLESFGYRVVTASDGAEGVAIFAAQRESIQLVLTDMMMPVMSGSALIEVILRIDPAARIIAASGLGTSGPPSRAAVSRVRDFLPKPYTAETLLNSVRRALDE